MAYEYRAEGEFLVQGWPSGPQTAPAIESLSGGGFVVTWADTSGDFGDVSGEAIVAQIFDADGAEIGSPFRVNNVTGGSQTTPDVTRLSNGGFVITWFHAPLSEVSGQVYDASGARIGSEFTATAAIAARNPSVTAIEGGGFVIAWSGRNAGAGDSDGGVFARTFDANGLQTGPAIRLNTQTSDIQSEVVLASLSGGRFIAAWSDDSPGSDGSGASIRGQLFTGTGAKIGVEFPVNTSVTGSQTDPAITVLANGNFVITWRDGGGDGSGSAVRGQMFTATGATLASEFRVNTQTLNDQDQATVAALKDGGFVVVWTDDSLTDDYSGAGIKAQRFDAFGAKAGTEFLVNQVEANDQLTPVITVLSDGSFVVAWENTIYQTIDARIFKAYVLPGDGDDSFSGTDGKDTIDGLGGNDTINGLSGDDVLRGGDGNDSIDGGSGTDSLDGGAGNDTLIAGLYGYSETLDGGADDDSLTGGTNYDSLRGCDGNDTIRAGDGNDWIDGGAGADRMEGGAGYDYFIVDNIGDEVIDTADGYANYVRSSISYVLSEAIRDLTLTGTADLYGTGNEGNNTITGNDGDNALSGEGGRDALTAGAGDDLLEGGTGDDTLRGEDGNDTLIGGEGADWFYGGAGDDTYYLEAGDKIFESGGGTDTVYICTSWRLEAGVERVIFTAGGDLSLWGNGDHNLFTGTAGNNTFTGEGGNDTMSGEGGYDKIDGGEGDDSLSGGSESDSLLGADGKDTLDGGAGGDMLSGGAGDDVLDGGGDNDILDGGTGADALTGGTGNDTYVVDDAGDVVSEGSNAGKDSVKTSISYVLTDNVEVLNLLGGDLAGTGNALSNSLNGAEGNNVLDGLSGSDSLYGWGGNDTLYGDGGSPDRLSGGTGADDFVITRPTGGVDTITDFETGLDRLVLDASEFGFAAGHVLTASEFRPGYSVSGTNGQFIWNDAGNELLWDADGTGAGVWTTVVRIQGTLTAEDIVFA